jgi:hypothetical protein
MHHIKTKSLEQIEDHIRSAPDEELETLASDATCCEMEACAKALAQRKAVRQATNANETRRRAQMRLFLTENPFDPRTEISPDTSPAGS